MNQNIIEQIFFVEAWDEKNRIKLDPVWSYVAKFCHFGNLFMGLAIFFRKVGKENGKILGYFFK